MIDVYRSLWPEIIVVLSIAFEIAIGFYRIFAMRSGR
jgi:hypothetical protein